MQNQLDADVLIGFVLHARFRLRRAASMAMRTIHLQLAHVEQARLDITRLRAAEGDSGCTEAAIALEHAIERAIKRAERVPGAATCS